MFLDDEQQHCVAQTEIGQLKKSASTIEFKQKVPNMFELETAKRKHVESWEMCESYFKNKGNVTDVLVITKYEQHWASVRKKTLLEWSLRL